MDKSEIPFSIFIDLSKAFDTLDHNILINKLQYFGITGTALRRRYTIRFARTEPADCPVHGSIVTCDMSLECPGHLKIG